MGVEGIDNLLHILWRGKFYIVLVLTLAIVASVAAYYFLDSRDLAAKLGQKSADYDDLNDKYNKLSYEHSTLVASNGDLNRRYADVSDRFNKLTVDNQYLKASYDDLTSKVNRMREAGGPSIALRYSFYEGGPSSNRKNYLEIWIYNVGDAREDRVTVKARTVNADNSTGVSEQAYTDVDALDKRYVKWEYSTAVKLNDVWYET